MPNLGVVDGLLAQDLEVAPHGAGDHLIDGADLDEVFILIL